MYGISDYLQRGSKFLNNQIFPGHKKLSRLMIYATDLCDSACKHCLIWAKRPVQHLPAATIIGLMKSKCISSATNIGLEGGEFMLHPEAMEILQWFHENHKNFDLLSNCLKPEKLIEAVKKYPPKRLYISLDGTEETYLYMRGKAGYQSVLQVIAALHSTVPISVMFTLSPYNDFSDMQHVAEVCKQYNIDLRVGVYNNVPLFDTYDKAHETNIGASKNDSSLQFKDVQQLKPKIEETKKFKEEEVSKDIAQPKHDAAKITGSFAQQIPTIVNDFPENYEYLVLYDEWRRKKLKLKCFSILESLVVLPNGDVPICQNLDLMLGNINKTSLDDIFNSEATIKQQKHYAQNCNQCWLAFHRKYDVALYRTFEKVFGKWGTNKLMGYYQWTDDQNMGLSKLLEQNAVSHV